VGGGAALNCFVVVLVVVGGRGVLDVCVDDATDFFVVLNVEGGGEAALVLVVDEGGFVEELEE
jgi:hypothetical protein